MLRRLIRTPTLLLKPQTLNKETQSITKLIPKIMDMDPTGTILFTTLGPLSYAFDIFSLPLRRPSSAAAADRLLSDSVSINFNAQFINNTDTIVFISERNGHPSIYSSQDNAPPKPLPCVTQSLFHDRPVLKNNTLYFISAHQQPDIQYKSWSALYSVSLLHQSSEITRLTPYGFVDYSPAVSLSGEFIAVASYGSRPWGGEFRELNTEIVVFRASDPTKRVVVSEKGGWPSWSGDSAVYFHRTGDDGWWSIFRVDFEGIDGKVSGSVRVTPPGVHCFTPAALHDGSGVVVATRRRESKFRHIELFEFESKSFKPLTEKVNPEIHHYNPFVSSDSEFVGYHRFRGRSSHVKTVIPYINPVTSPINGLRLLRINGVFPALSPVGDLIADNHDLNGDEIGLKIVKSDGSKRWTLIKSRIAFCNSWSDNTAVITSIGPIFDSVKATVQIARITFNAEDLHGGDGDFTGKCNVKILTKEETGNNAFPSCSPDGKSIVFRSGRSGHKNLYIIDAVDGEVNGGNARRLTDGAWIDTMPAWSPKGDLIAFSSNRHKAEDESVFSVYVVSPDGTGLRRVHVAGNEGSDEIDRERINHVCFSRDGEWLLFTANLGGVTAEPVTMPNQFQPYGDLYVVRVDGSGLRRLTWSGYENGTPSWGSPEFGRSEDGECECDDELMGQFDEPLWLTCHF